MTSARSQLDGTSAISSHGDGRLGSQTGISADLNSAASSHQNISDGEGHGVAGDLNSSNAAAGGSGVGSSLVGINAQLAIIEVDDNRVGSPRSGLHSQLGNSHDGYIISLHGDVAIDSDGAKILAITDSISSPAWSLADHAVITEINLNEMGFNSFSCLYCLFDSIVAKIRKSKCKSISTRLHDLEELYSDFDLFYE